jgi:HEAT repeat protein
MPASKSPQRPRNGSGPGSEDLQATLEALFDAERELRQQERRLLSATEQSTLVDVLCRAREEAKQIDDPFEMGMRLERLADLYAQVPSTETTQALLALLDEEDPGVRVQAADALVDISSERYGAIVQAIQQRLQQGDDGLAMRELPWILVEIGEADTLQLLAQFLEHAVPEIVASAAEAIVSTGVAEAADLLKSLTGDTRNVDLEQLDGETEGTAVLGDLIQDAIDELSPTRGRH